MIEAMSLLPIRIEHPQPNITAVADLEELRILDWNTLSGNFPVRHRHKTMRRSKMTRDARSQLFDVRDRVLGAPEPHQYRQQGRDQMAAG